MRMRRRSGRFCSRSRRMMSRKSSFIPRSWISSTTTWLTPSSSGSLTSLRSRTPVVQKSSRVPSLRRFSRRIWYPTESPTLSPRSAATRCETDTAEIRRGCVQMMLHRAPRPASISLSRMNCGSWVVFPHPVSPLITRTCAGKGAFVSSSHAAGGGARFRAGSPRRPGRPSWPSPHLVLPDHSQQLLPLAVRRELAAEGQHLLRLPAAARLLLPRLELLALRLVHGRVLREVSAPSSATQTPTPQVLRRSTRRRGRSRGSGWGSGEDDEWLGASRRRRGGARTSPGAGTHHVRLAAPPLLGGPVVLYGERGEHLPPAAPELRRVRLGERGRLELVQGVLHDPLLPGAHLQLELPLAVVEVRAVVGQRPLAHGQRRVPARPVLLGVQAEPRRYVQDDVLRTAGGGRGWTDGAGSARRTRMHLLFPPPLLSVFLTSPSRP